MNRSYIFCFVSTSTALLLCAAVAQGPLFAASPLAGKSPPMSASVGTELRPTIEEAAEQRMREILARPLRMKFDKLTMNDFAQYIEKQSEIRTRIDEAAFHEAGIGDAMIPATDVADLTLNAFLRRMFTPLRCTSVLTQDGTLLITTDEAANSLLETKIYQVQDLVAAKDELDERVLDYPGLIECISNHLRPQSWDAVGGPGSATGYQGVLVIAQTQDVQRLCASFLTALREARARQEKTPGGETIQVGLSPAEKAAHERIRAALARPIDADFNATHLRDIVKWLSATQGISFQFDEKALQHEKRDWREQLHTLHVHGQTGNEILRRVLEPLKLTTVVHDEVLMITSQRAAADSLQTRVYLIADLLDWSPLNGIEQPPVSDLLDALVETVQPKTWDYVGGPGSIDCYLPAKALVISQTQSAHDDIQAWLADLRSRRVVNPSVASSEGMPPEDKFITARFYLDRTNLQPVEVAQLVRKTLGEKIWSDPGSFLQPFGPADSQHPTAELVRDAPSEQYAQRTLLVCRHKPAVLREVRRLLHEMDVLQKNLRGSSAASIVIASTTARFYGGCLCGDFGESGFGETPKLISPPPIISAGPKPTLAPEVPASPKITP